MLCLEREGNMLLVPPVVPQTRVAISSSLKAHNLSHRRGQRKQLCLYPSSLSQFIVQYQGCYQGMALSLFLLLMDLHVSIREKQHRRKHTGRSSLSRKDLQWKNCCGSAAMGVMKPFTWERRVLFCIYIHQQSCLWTSHPLGKVAPAYQEGWLKGLQSQGSREPSQR